MGKSTIKFLLQCFIAIVIFSAHLSSADMVGMSTEELTLSSDTVITGQVEDVKSQWSKDGKTIVTNVSIIPSQVLRGNAVGQKVVLEYEGGEVGDIGLKVSDMPAFIKGENVLLFLKEGKSKANGTVHNVVGKAQGAYKVNPNGVASKKGFSAVGKRNIIDNDMPVDVLIEKIKGVKQ